MANSLAKRQTFRIIVAAVAMIVVITGIVYYSVREFMLEEAQVLSTIILLVMAVVLIAICLICRRKISKNTTPEKRIGPSLNMPAQMSDIGQLQPFIACVARQAGVDGKEAKRLRLAAEEAVANVINYGQATTITLQAAWSGNKGACNSTEHPQLRITIDDDGRPFDPTAYSGPDLSIPPDQRPPGGIGIVLLRQMADGLNYQRTDGHNLLTIIKDIK